MAANTLPIYTAVPDIQGSSQKNSGTIVGPSANTATDGTGANAFGFFQAGANGSYVQKVVLKAVASPAQTVARIFYCNSTSGTFTGNTTNTATTSTLIDEVALPTVSVSQTAVSPKFELPLNYALPPSTWLFVTFGTSTGAAGNGWAVTGVGGDY